MCGVMLQGRQARARGVARVHGDGMAVGGMVVRVARLAHRTRHGASTPCCSVVWQGTTHVLSRDEVCATQLPEARSCPPRATAEWPLLAAHEGHCTLVLAVHLGIRRWCVRVDLRRHCV